MSFGVFEAAKDIANSSLKSASPESSESSPYSTLLDVVGSKGSRPNRKINVTVTEGEVKPSALKTGPYKFINSSTPQDLKASEHRKAVRSQAARLLPVQDGTEGNVKSKKRRRQTRPTKNITFHIDLRVSTACTHAEKQSEETTPAVETTENFEPPSISVNSIGGWPAPFAQLPLRSHAFAPGLMHHCKPHSFDDTHMARASY